MPKFAIRHHKDFKFGDSYQEFSKKMFRTIPKMVGLRMAESMQRWSSISKKRGSKDFVYPIYDWKDDDVWLYIQRNNLEIPVAYMYLYKVGVPRNRLRISQFFSVDTIRVLPKVLEFYPDLYERIIRREPNAELVMLYWDTEMFRSSRQSNTHDKNKDYRKLFNEEMEKAAKHPDMYPGYVKCKRLWINVHENMSNRVYKRMYGLLIGGDPKNRERRAILGQIRKDLKKQHNEQNKN
jgi:predicted phosphoadenosine phosphosulfate sulfurtransferase